MALVLPWRFRFLERWTSGQALVPSAELRACSAPIQIRHAELDAERAGERELHHVEPAAHQGMRNLPFPEVGEPRGAVHLVANNRGRAFVRRPIKLAQPDRK